METICIFAGSSVGNRKIYTETAKDLAASIIDHGYKIVFGGGSNGLMGILADSALDAGGHITGIITEQLNNIEVGHKGLSELVIVETMHDRKKEMAERSDAVVCLPGGVGTWEEFFESLTWNQLGLQSKPIILLNLDDYYTLLSQFVEHSVAEGFLPRSTANELIFVNSIAEAIEQLQQYVPKDKANWFKRLQE
ncbi:MAG TPA: TIGR00730 family Rossman fold protein [Gammaproteobacteria bacterium]|nr:TIGR00730 family Rossman fold protein [Gammaproteobacteria bacterium]